ncbi:MAG TPA: MG2 domain-containing protein, partial [Thermoanaerobaculia bacterium]
PVGKAVTVIDITNPAKEQVVKPARRDDEDYDYATRYLGLDQLGYSLLPAHRYLVRVDPALTAEDGQKLGYAWMATIENSNRSAFVSFGDGQGVWEATGGSVLPFHVRNYRTIKQWIAPLALEQLVPTLVRLQKEGFVTAPPGTKATTRNIPLAADKIQAIGLDVKPALGGDEFGLVWAAVEPGTIMPGAKVYDPRVRATVVQVTNLGISVKDSPHNTLILVTTLDDAKPVAGANVSVRNIDNKVVWTGVTDAQGLAIAPNSDWRRPKPAEGFSEDDDDWRATSELHFVVIAEKDGDTAYVGSDWNEGITSWELGVDFDITEKKPLLRGTVFTDRGVYKLGEEAHLKAIVRSDTPTGMQLLPGAKLEVWIRDNHDKEVDRRTLTLNEWSGADWTVRLPGDGSLGTYTIYAQAPGQRLQIFGDFLVAAYRRPDFRVDATLTGGSTIAGARLDARATGRYLFGAPMNGAQVSWSYSKKPSYEIPPAIRDRWQEERWEFLGWDPELSHEWQRIAEQESKLDAKGEVREKLDTDKTAGWPYTYRFEAVVTDVTRQQIANRAMFRVDPAPWYIGLKRPPYFADIASGLDTEIVAAGIDGLAVPGVTVKVKLQRIQWNSVRSSEGGGFYGWESERKEVPAGEWTITTQAQPVPLKAKVEAGGEYQITATAVDKEGRTAKTVTSFYALGSGYTAWERYDHNRIDLVPEKKNYKPGDTARIMVKSP